MMELNTQNDGQKPKVELVIDNRNNNGKKHQRKGQFSLEETKTILARMEEEGYVFRDHEKAILKAMLMQQSGVKVVIASGKPGVGKTYLGEVLAKVLETEPLYYMMHSWTDDQDLFNSINVEGVVKKKSDEVDQDGILKLAAKRSLESEKPVVLILDELDKAPERVDVLLFELLENGRIPVNAHSSMQADIDNMIIFITTNNKRELSPPLIRRVRQMFMQPHKQDVIKKVVSEKLGIPKGIVSLILKAGITVANEDDKFLSMQELEHMVLDIVKMAKKPSDVAHYLASWAAIGEKSEKFAKKHFLINAIWGEVQKYRKKVSENAHNDANIDYESLSVEEATAIVERIEEEEGYVLRDEERLNLIAMLTQKNGVKVALLNGLPGVGKTSIAKKLAKVLGSNYMDLLFHSWVDKDELYHSVNVSGVVREDPENVLNEGVLLKAAIETNSGKYSPSKPLILLLDEIDKTRDVVENLLLDFMQSGRVQVKTGEYVYANLDNLMIFVTSNAQRDLSDALLRRMRRVFMKPLSLEQMNKIVCENTGANKGLVTTILKFANDVAEKSNRHFSLREAEDLVSTIVRCAEKPAEIAEYIISKAINNEEGLVFVYNDTKTIMNIWSELCKMRSEKAKQKMTKEANKQKLNKIINKQRKDNKLME